MAKNREPVKPVEYETDPSEDNDEEDDEPSEKPSEYETDPTEEEDDDEASSESDSEPELTQIAKTPSSSSTPAAAKKPLPQSASKPSQPEPSSSSEEESESESESDSDGPNPEVRPIETKPTNDAHKTSNGARKPRPQPAASKLATPTESAAGKRQAEEKETVIKDSKKAKSEKSPTDDNSKKPPSQRNRKEEDNIRILPKMIDCSTKKKSVGGTVEEMILAMGDKMFAEGKGAEEWKRLKVEEAEAYVMRLDVKTKQAKLAMGTLKSG